MKMRELESKTCPFRKSEISSGADCVVGQIHHIAMLAIPHLLVMLVATFASRRGDLKRSKRSPSPMSRCDAVLRTDPATHHNMSHPKLPMAGAHRSRHL